MKTITLKSPDGKTTFRVIAYKSGEGVEVFKGATGRFGALAGDKTAGLVYVVEGNNAGISASDVNIDHDNTWDWIQEWMQKGMNAECVISDAAHALEQLLNVPEPMTCREHYDYNSNAERFAKSTLEKIKSLFPAR